MLSLFADLARLINKHMYISILYLCSSSKCNKKNNMSFKPVTDYGTHSFFSFCMSFDKLIVLLVPVIYYYWIAVCILELPANSPQNWTVSFHSFPADAMGSYQLLSQTGHLFLFFGPNHYFLLKQAFSV